MEAKHIYLAGAMGCFGKERFDEGNDWRIDVKSYLIKSVDRFNLDICNPNDYFNFLNITYKSQKEVMNFDLNKVRHADLIIVNFNDENNSSLGTMSEIAIAYEKRIPVIGLNKSKKELHPWQLEMTDRIFDDMNKMLTYIKDYYLS